MEKKEYQNKIKMLQNEIYELQEENKKWKDIAVLKDVQQSQSIKSNQNNKQKQQPKNHQKSGNKKTYGNGKKKRYQAK